MIEYIEVRDENTQVIGIIDTARSVIWHAVFFGVGDFEIEAAASPAHVSLLRAGRYVTRPDNDEVGIIESVQTYEDIDSGSTIKASGRFAKSMLDRRLIYNLSGTSNNATILQGNVENAVREVVKSNAIACPFDSARNIPLLALGTAAGFDAVIVDADGNPAQKQVTYENLLTYTDGVLEEYDLASKCVLRDGVFRYTLYNGSDRSVMNAVGNLPVIFSKEYDNLNASEFSFDSTPEKNVALIGGEGEGVDRFYALLSCPAQGLQRREMWVDAKSTKKTLKASEVQDMFPTGAFTGITFNVGGAIYATLVHADATKEYTLKALQEKFPTGTTSGTTFSVDGVVYGNRVYGDEEKYTLTPIGYKAMLDAEEREGNYTLTDAVYTSLLTTKGKEKLATLVAKEEFKGTIDAMNGNYIYGRDFVLGDIVTVQDNTIGLYVNVRIREALEYQDDDGYSVEVKYQ